MARKSAIDSNGKNAGRGKRIIEFYYIPGENISEMINGRILKREELC